MNIEKKISNLENLVYGIIKDINIKNDNQKNNIDICANDISNITPTILTKTAYIDDTEIIFTDVPSGNVSVFMVTDSGMSVNTITEIIDNTIRVSFDKLEEVATITLSIQ